MERAEHALRFLRDGRGNVVAFFVEIRQKMEEEQYLAALEASGSWWTGGVETQLLQHAELAAIPALLLPRMTQLLLDDGEFMMIYYAYAAALAGKSGQMDVAQDAVDALAQAFNMVDQERALELLTRMSTLLQKIMHG